MRMKQIIKEIFSFLNKEIPLNAFTLIELLVTIAIVGLLVSIVLVSLQGAQASARDGKRDAEAGEAGSVLRKTLEVYNSTNGKYPYSINSEDSEGCCVEDDATIKDAIRPYLSAEIKDPLYNPTEPDDIDKYCYRYKTVNNGEEYKIRVNYEKGESKEVASWGGEGIVFPRDIVFIGEAIDDNLGVCVASAGDVNNDGFDDVIMGAEKNDAGAPGAGRAYIHYGGQNMDSAAEIIMTGQGSNDAFGDSVASAGDVNNDGYDDVIVGAFRSTGAGRAYIYYGGSIMNNIVDVYLNAEASYSWDYFAHAAASAGDVNNDGYDDVIVGAASNDAGGIDAGRAYLYYGGPAMNNVADVIFTGGAASDGLGESVASAGDVNNDGYDDVIVGAPGAYGTGIGHSYVYYGGPAMNNVADIIFTGEAGGDVFGGSVASAGDVNDDGYDDVIVGAQANDAGGNAAGRAYIYYGGPAMDNVADIIFTGESYGDYFGWDTALAGDVNDDGYDDVIVGAGGNDVGGPAAGRAYIYYGGPAMDSIADIIFTGKADLDLFGDSVASAGDVNNDGNEDIIVGAISNAVDGPGRVYLFQGPNSRW